MIKAASLSMKLDVGKIAAMIPAAIAAPAFASDVISILIYCFN